MSKTIFTTIKDLLEFFNIEHQVFKIKLVSNKHTLVRSISSSDINRPGMNLFGFFDYFAFERLQVLGKGESAYIKKLEREKNIDLIKELFEYDIPAFVFSNNYTPPSEFIKLAEKKSIPVLVTNQSTTDLINRLQEFFNKVLAPKVVVHGVLMEIFGMGVLIEGASGVGKSECALELIERGHRFIADDVVDIRLIENSFLLGTGSKIIAHHMEIRGIGIINIAHLFGVGSIRNEKKIDLIIELEAVTKNKKYDRVGLQSEYKDILKVKIPKLRIPIQPGTNTPILVETAAMNQRLKVFGYNPAKEFSKKLDSLIRQGVDIY